MNQNAIIDEISAAPKSETRANCWKVAGCSIPGTAHLRKSQVCEDSAGWYVNGELLVVAIADGAGSATKAALGSALAAHTALATIMEMDLTVHDVNATSAKTILKIACQRSLNSVASKAVDLSIEPSALATTLIVLLAHRDFVAAGHVGDGAVVLVNTMGDLIPLTTPTSGEFANETLLLGCSSSNQVRVSSLTGFPLIAIAAFTDGLQRLALQMPGCTPHPPFFLPLFKRLSNLSEFKAEKVISEFLDSPRVIKRSDDDKTLVVAQLL